MLFFSKQLVDFNKGFSFIFGLGIEQDDMENEEQEREGGNEKDKETVTEADEKFGFMSLIHDYSDFTKTKWSEVWEVNIIEFFQMLAFIKEYKRREQEAIKKYQREHKWD